MKNKLWNASMMRRLCLCLMCIVCLGISSPLWAQGGREVKGQVVDETGLPMIGASVLVKGTSTGVITDLDGNFVLKVISS